MPVVEPQKEPLPVSQQVLEQCLLIAHLFDDPGEVHLFFEFSLSVALDLLHVHVDTAQAELEELGAR